MGRAAHARIVAKFDTGTSGPTPPAMIENDIRDLLDDLAVGENAPTLARIEDALTAGYAHAMALEAEQWRLQRRISELAVELADDRAELRPELRKLAKKLREADTELAQLRALLGSLRARAAEARAA